MPCHIIPRGVIAEDGREHATEEPVRLGVEATDDPPVDHADPAIFEQQQVPCVHVAMEHLVADGHQEEALDQLLDERCWIDAEPLALGEVVDSDAIEVRHRQDVRT